MGRVKPLTPEEAQRAAIGSFPDEVIASFNECIAETLRNSSAKVERRRVLELIRQKMPEVTHQEVLNKRWLDVETLYEEAGWEVRYEHTSIGDTLFEPYFIFRRRE